MNLFKNRLGVLCGIAFMISCSKDQIEPKKADPEEEIITPVSKTENELALQKIYDNSGGNGSSDVITFEDLETTKAENLLRNKLTYYIDAIAVKTDFSDPAKLVELQALIDLVNKNNEALLWSDEFDVDGTPNPDNWTYDLGATGWGNNEVQNYTKENAEVENGILKITAKKLMLPKKSGNNLADFEEALEYSFTNLTIENKNDKNGNASKVGKIVNVAAGIWEAAVIEQANYISLLDASKRVITMDFYQEEATVRKLILKLEGANKGSQTTAAGKIEVQTTTTATAGWQTLTFDFGSSATVPGDTSGGKILLEYTKMVVFVDPGIATKGTYFIDNISGAEFGGNITTTNNRYTSARMKTEGLFSFTYGRVEVRAKLPNAQGTWPAIWMLGDNIRSIGWPKCGEIDIMEQTGWDKSKTIAACHWDSSGHAKHSNETSVQNTSTEFHIYSLEWSASTIKISVDNNLFYTLDISVDSLSEFRDSNFFIILNIAMGGTLGGAIDPNFTESVMEIDYVRVYQ